MCRPTALLLRFFVPSPNEYSLIGAHLPGYPAEGWASSKISASCSPSVGITCADAAAYRTSFKLDLPPDADIPIALKLTPTTDISKNITSDYRAMIYINGRQFGRYR